MKKILLFFSFIFLFSSFSQTKIKYFEGIASYYSNKFNGRLTANGNIFSNTKYTAASNKIPLESIVKVTNLKNNKHVIVYINDHMNKNNKRLIDLSRKAATQLKFINQGICQVKVEVISSPSTLQEIPENL